MTTNSKKQTARTNRTQKVSADKAAAILAIKSGVKAGVCRTCGLVGGYNPKG